MAILFRTSTVFDQHNRPVAGALVEIRDDAGELVDIGARNPIVTDFAGVWEAVLPVGVYAISISKGSAQLAYSLTVPEITEGELVQVSEVVRDQHGNVVAGASVVAYSADGEEINSFVTDYTGTWAGDLPSGELVLVLSKGDYFAVRKVATYDGSTNVVATPVLTPGSGAYADGQEVVITCDTAGATIRYTDDGTPVDGSSTIYVDPLVLSLSGELVDPTKWLGAWDFAGDSDASVLTGGSAITQASQWLPTLAPISGSAINVPSGTGDKSRAAGYSPQSGAITAGARVNNNPAGKPAIKIAYDITSTGVYSEAIIKPEGAPGTIRIGLSVSGFSGATPGNVDITGVGTAPYIHLAIEIDETNQLIAWIDGVRHTTGLYWPAATKGGIEYYAYSATDDVVIDNCFVYGGILSAEAHAALAADQFPDADGHLTAGGSPPVVTLKAKAFKPGWIDSSTATETYTAL